ncbi:MAG: GAF domain-containing protein, partial [Pedobacter sp.]
DNINHKRSYQRRADGNIFDVSIWKTGYYQIIDIEPASDPLSSHAQSAIGRSLSEILSEKSLQCVLSNAALQIRELIGYDRVMIYKFHRDGHGEVVAEEKEVTLESWMGLHYPASDIPRQARELYKFNLIRLIADVSTVPSGLCAGKNVLAPLDLTHSNLRAVSPIHIQYLKNMGVASSFSVSIIEDGELWGLIACHSYSPKIIGYEQRENAKLIGQVLGSAISFRERQELQINVANHTQALDAISRNLSRNLPIEQALITGEVKMNEIIPCLGAAVYTQGKLHLTENAPDAVFIHQFISWLDQEIKEEGYYISNRLSTDFPPAAAYRKSASGVLACRLGKNLSEYLLWFRPEIISTVRWAGNPEKTITSDQQGMTHISPRNSFVEWKERVEYSSLPWLESEQNAATILRDEVNFAINRQTIELRAMHEKLRQAYSELDTFSYTIAHDLKTPLTTIKSFAQLLSRGSLSKQKIVDIVGRINHSTDKIKSPAAGSMNDLGI